MTGEEFRRARIRACITQRRLGEMLGYKGRCAENVVQNWEYDRQPIPIKHFRQLAKILEIPLEKFIP
ncbi:MAG: helix-turn-helix transcriptional regulator [Bacteroidaceae bacterium]|nr:helix-turn-helix transcriptional regulator [Bacteroidaceae bacterium]